MKNYFKDKLIVSIEQAVAAPYCTAKLADAGARVIKVERKDCLLYTSDAADEP